jgi:hypothetical protein
MQLCHNLFVGSDTLGGSCTFNVGIYETDGTVKDEDVFATSVADEAALADVRFQAADSKHRFQKTLGISW